MSKRRLLIVVDYQNDFVTGSLGFEEAEQIEEALCEKICEARAEGADLLFTLDTHEEDYLETQEGRKLPVPHCIRETSGWELCESAAALREGAPLLEKSSFGSAELIRFLQDGKYESVELCGVVTSICVLSNAVLAKAALPEAEILIDARATADSSEKLRQETFDLMERLQMTVLHREQSEYSRHT